MLVLLTLNGAIVLVAQLVALAKVVVSLRRDPALPRRLLWASLAQLRRGRWLWNGGCCEESDSPERKLLKAKLLDQRRLQLATYIIWFGFVTSVVRGVEMQVRAIQQEDPGNPLPIEFRFTRSLQLLGATAVVAFPKQTLNRRMLPFLHLAGMTSLCWCVSPLAITETAQLANITNQVLILSFVMTGICLHFGLACVSNTALSLCIVAGFASCSDAPEDLTVMTVLRYESLNLFLKLMIIFGASMVLNYSVTREMDAQLGRCQLSAVMSLLDLMCDVVIDLSTDLTLAEHSAKLAALLMHRTSGKSLKDVSLVDFVIAGDDQAHFVQCIERHSVADNGKPSPGMFSAPFRDAVGTQVKFLVFHVPYIGIDGTLKHFVGLREDSDDFWRQGDQLGNPIGVAASHSRGTSFTPGVLRPELATKLGSGRSQESPGRGHEADSQADNVSGRSRSSLGSGGGSSVGSMGSKGPKGAKLLAMKVAVGSTNLVHNVNGEPDMSSRLDELFDGDAGADFLAWMRKSADEVKRGSTAPRTECFGTVKLSMRKGGQALVCECQAEVEFPAPPDDESARQDYCVNVFFRRSRRGSASSQSNPAPRHRGTGARLEATVLGAGWASGARGAAGSGARGAGAVGASGRVGGRRAEMSLSL